MAEKVWIGGAAGATTSWNQAANWSPSGVPAAGDDVVLPAGAAYAVGGYDNSAVGLNSLIVENGFTQTIGASSMALTLYFPGGTCASNIVFEGSGISFLSVNGAADVEVRKAGASTTSGAYDLNITGTGNTNLYFEPDSSSARCGLAALAGQTASFQNIYCQDGNLNVGDGVTFGTNNITLAAITGGELTLRSTVNTLKVDAGEVLFQGPDSAVAAVNVWGGILRWDSEADITALHLSGTIDFTPSMAAKTVTNCFVYQGGSLKDASRIVTYTNGIKLAGTNIANASLDLGRDVTLTPS